MLNVKQITEEIPKLMAKKTNQEIADHFGVTKWQIEYWIKQLRARGYEVPENRRRGRTPRI